jgi:hypothetical protein
MTFLNPTFLFALLASAIPILIHLLNLRRLKTVEFSSVKFLKELQFSRIRSLKIKQLILLMLRVLGIVFLVLAFARPVIKGYLFKPILSGQAKSSVVIILDNTLSMASVDENGKFINQAKSIANGIASLLNESDEFALIRLSDIPDVSTDGFIHDVGYLKKLIEETNFVYSHKKITDAITVAGRIIENSKNLNREIYIISDFQKSEFTSEIKKDFKLSPDVKVFLVNVGNFTKGNLSVDKVEIKNRIIFSGRTLALEANVTNHGDSDVENYVVSVFLNGRRVAQKSVNLAGKSSKTVDFNILTEEMNGFVDGFVEIEDDNFNFDNRRYFTLYIPNEIKILLVGSSDDLKFLQLAFSTIKEMFKSAFFKITETTLQSGVNFSNFDVVFVVNPNYIDRQSAVKLKSFVSNGGGLVIFLGSKLDAKLMNQNFNSIFGLPELEGIVKQKMFFSRVEYNNPIFEGVFVEKPRKIDSPEIIEYVKFKTTYGLTSIIELGDGTPFLAEKTEGNGRILIYTTEPNDKFSNLPYKSIFIPLVLQSVLYLSNPINLKPEYSIGDTVEIPQYQVVKFFGGNSRELKLNRPDGSDFAFRLSDTQLNLSYATIPGVYSVSENVPTKVSGKLIKIAFNPPKEESVYEKITEAEIENLMKRLGVGQYRFLTPGDERKIANEILRARYGVELWKFFLALSLLSFLIESIISRKM